MTYTLVNLVFLVPALTIAALAWRSGALSRIVLLVTAGAMIALTIVFDNLMIGIDLFSYAEDRISGVMIGLMPIEDLAYTVVAVLLLPALWELLGRRRRPESEVGALPDSAVRRDPGIEPGAARHTADEEVDRRDP